MWWLALGQCVVGREGETYGIGRLRGSFDNDMPLVDIGVLAEADLDSWERRVCGFIELLYIAVVSDER